MRRGRAAIRSWTLAWVACLAGAASSARAELQPLYVVPTEDHRQHPVAADAPLHLEFETLDRDRLLAGLGPAAVATGPTTVRLDLPFRVERPYAEDRPGRWLDATFLLDHDQPEIVALRDEFHAARPDDEPDVATVLAFVASRLEAVTGRGWEPASLTARSLRGDCTEHAVLTATLARSLGIPARVVIGMAIVRPGEHYAAMGHAWAELRDGDRWAIADAALGPLSASTRYVSLGLLEDEGPGYLLSLAGTLSGWATRVVVLDD